MEVGREDTVQHREVVPAAEAEWMVPHSHVVNKIQEGHLGSKQSQPQAILHSTEFQHQEDKAPLPLPVKNQWELEPQKKLLDFHCLKGLRVLRMYTNFQLVTT